MASSEQVNRDDSSEPNHHDTNSRMSLISKPTPMDDNFGGKLDSHSKEISQQLMYPEKFSDLYKEERLKVLHKTDNKDSSLRLQTYAVPQNPILSKIKDFLPQLSNANKNMASDVASNSQSHQILTIEPSGHSDESEDEECDEMFSNSNEENDEGSHVEMSISILPPEILAKFEEESDSSDESDDNTDSRFADDLSSVTRPSDESIEKPNIEDITCKKDIAENIPNR